MPVLSPWLPSVAPGSHGGGVLVSVSGVLRWRRRVVLLLPALPGGRGRFLRRASRSWAGAPVGSHRWRGCGVSVDEAGALESVLTGITSGTQLSRISRRRGLFRPQMGILTGYAAIRSPVALDEIQMSFAQASRPTSAANCSLDAGWRRSRRLVLATTETPPTPGDPSEAPPGRIQGNGRGATVSDWVVRGVVGDMGISRQLWTGRLGHSPGLSEVTFR